MRWTGNTHPIVRVTGALLARFQGALSLLARTSQECLVPTLRRRRATGVSQVMKREFPPKVSGPRPSGLKARFGSFQLLPRQRLLFNAGKRVPIGSRAFDILMLLIERAGEVVTKEEIMIHAWPRTIVEETNLRVHIAGLRRALGDDQTTSRYLSNVIGRGYSFVGSVIWESDPTSASLAASTPPSRSVHSFPIPLTRIIGRSKDIDLLTSTLPQRRILTIVGAGGVGKSALARAVGFELRDHHRQGAYLVDLGEIADAVSLPVSLAFGYAASACRSTIR